MKIRNIFIALILLTACAENDNRSDAYGNFEATEVIVSSKASGSILEFNIEEGDIISEGKLVGIIDSTDLYLKKQQALKQRNAIGSQIENIDSQIAVQKQQLKNLEVDQKRIANLYKDGAATRKQLDDINGAVDLVKKQIVAIQTQKRRIVDEIEALDMQIAQIDEGISYCYVKNPVQGTVLTKLAEAGEVTTFGKPLYKIANLDIVKLKVYVSGVQLPHIKLGQEVEVLIDKDETSNTRLKGRISWISESAEFTPKTIQTKDERVNLVYAVKVDVKNDGSLKIGMPGEINFEIANK